jgi:uncharacterized protein (DUF983 family)
MKHSLSPVSPFSTGLRCRCPRCGIGRLFRGLLTVDGNCDNCGLDLKVEDSGDGPAVFVMFAIGPIVVGLAVWLEMLFAPPYWLHMVIWPPLVLLGSIALLRPFKATLIALQFRNKAHHIGLNTFDPKD